MNVDKALIDKVKALTGPSHSVDQEVCRSVGSPLSLMPHTYDFSTGAPGAYRFTESVDWNMRLLQEALPGWSYVIDSTRGIVVRLYPGPDSPYFYQGTGSTPAIAFLVAILTALGSLK